VTERRWARDSAPELPPWRSQHAGGAIQHATLFFKQTGGPIQKLSKIAPGDFVEPACSCSRVRIPASSHNDQPTPSARNFGSSYWRRERDYSALRASPLRGRRCASAKIAPGDFVEPPCSCSRARIPLRRVDDERSQSDWFSCINWRRERDYSALRASPLRGRPSGVNTTEYLERLATLNRTTTQSSWQTLRALSLSVVTRS
jgi:hypothetical protein